MSVTSIYRWHAGELVPLDYCDMTDTTIEVADSWLVHDGSTLALGVHRARFLESMAEDARAATDADSFWDAAIALIPREGEWFPRVELQGRAGALLLVFRLRSAPERTNNVVVATWHGADPRTIPRIKGPDLAAMTRIRTVVQAKGAGEAIISTAEGFVVEGAVSGLLWWRGGILCGPPAEFARVGSVTVRSILTLATALGVETHEEAVTPPELAGVELWSANALHGIRIVRDWMDGPALAQLPGRLPSWRARMDALTKPIWIVSAT